MAKRKRRAYILILPSLFTTASLFSGYYSILASFNEDFEKAAYAIVLAGLFDLLDGRVARITRSATHFGMEYDSIADVVSFGVAPAILAYVWVLSSLGRIGWAGSFFFAACGALRLARFNAISEEMPKSYFLGLPIPAAAIAVAAITIAYHQIPFENPEAVMLAMTFGLGLLMVSNVRYRSLKDFDLRHKRSFFYLVLLVMMIAFIAIRPEIAGCLILLYYILWAPVRELLSFSRRSVLRRRENPASVGADKHP
ncbi:MAG: CDP-diacylglycerol--serine O-phosphatidyltransferase [Bdellovibrionales bacterium]|nr:CDP-diacylglycerol--serine O-phosphatidyltransferase [Bdellovibrionales bacterium]